MMKAGQLFVLKNAMVKHIHKVISIENDVVKCIMWDELMFGDSEGTHIVYIMSHIKEYLLMISTKTVALEMITQYIHNPNTVGFEQGTCVYKTASGNMCIAGKCMLEPETKHSAIKSILMHEGESVFKPFYRDLFTYDQWTALQAMHDTFAVNYAIELINFTPAQYAFPLNRHDVEQYIKENHTLWLP